VPVRETELRSVVMPVALGYLPYHLLLLFLCFGAAIMCIFTHTHTHTHTHIYQEAVGQIHALKYLPPDARGACGHVLSSQAINVAASRDLSA
jgi:hypothetical protein